MPKDLRNALDSEVKRVKSVTPKKRPTRASVCSEIVRERLIRPDEPDGTELHRRMLVDVKTLRKIADESRRSGDTAAFRKSLLLAAAMEIEALAAQSDPSEEAVRSTLLESLCLLKDAIGYARLPEVPSRTPVTVPSV